MFICFVNMDSDTAQTVRTKSEWLQSARSAQSATRYSTRLINYANRATDNFHLEEQQGEDIDSSDPEDLALSDYSEEAMKKPSKKSALPPVTRIQQTHPLYARETAERYVEKLEELQSKAIAMHAQHNHPSGSHLESALRQNPSQFSDLARAHLSPLNIQNHIANLPSSVGAGPPPGQRDSRHRLAPVATQSVQASQYRTLAPEAEGVVGSSFPGAALSMRSNPLLGPLSGRSEDPTSPFSVAPSSSAGTFILTPTSEGSGDLSGPPTAAISSASVSHAAEPGSHVSGDLTTPSIAVAPMTGNTFIPTRNPEYTAPVLAHSSTTLAPSSHVLGSLATPFTAFVPYTGNTVASPPIQQHAGQFLPSSSATVASAVVHQRSVSYPPQTQANAHQRPMPAYNPPPNPATDGPSVPGTVSTFSNHPDSPLNRLPSFVFPKGWSGVLPLPVLSNVYEPPHDRSNPPLFTSESQHFTTNPWIPGPDTYQLDDANAIRQITTYRNLGFDFDKIADEMRSVGYQTATTAGVKAVWEQHCPPDGGIWPGAAEKGPGFVSETGEEWYAACRETDADREEWARIQRENGIVIPSDSSDAGEA
ncbi:MAG: hypothetical protein Q9218_007303 [Villophora microphyllina]